MEYVCKFADERGQVREQVEEAESESEIRDRFAQQGLLLYSVRPKGGVAAVLRRHVAAPKKRLNVEQFLIFNQQFVTLVRAGLPILRALELLATRVAHRDLRAHVLEVRERVRAGALLSAAFEEQGMFPKMYTTSLLAGEKSGNLEGVLDRYIAYQRIALSVRKKLLVSLVYPALLVVLVIGLVTFLTTYVVPTFAELYRGMDTELPPLTQLLMAFGLAVRQYLVVAVLLLAIGIPAALAWARSPRGAEALDRLKLRLPVAGEIWLKYQVAQLARMLSTLLTGGIPLVAALQTTGESFESRLVRRAVETATRAVREGRSLSAGLAEGRLIPELTVEMVEVGESTGALPQMLNSVAEFFEEDVNTSLQALLALVEPAILIFMGTVVAFVLISLYLPIFSLAGKVG